MAKPLTVDLPALLERYRLDREAALEAEAALLAARAALQHSEPAFAEKDERAAFRCAEVRARELSAAADSRARTLADALLRWIKDC
jgi:hypothetical protein